MQDYLHTATCEFTTLDIACFFVSQALTTNGIPAGFGGPTPVLAGAGTSSVLAAFCYQFLTQFRDSSSYNLIELLYKWKAMPGLSFTPL